MTKTKTIAVIGGTGKAGKYLVAHLLQQGFSLRLLLRDPSAYQPAHPLITPVKGDARDYASLYSLTEGCDAVISTLGQPQGGLPIFSEATTHILQAMEQRHIRRYVVVTGLSIEVPGDQKGTYATQASKWMKRSFPAVIADKQKEYSILAENALDWTLVRVPMIRQTEEITGVTVDLKDCLGESISAADLARFLTAQLTDQQYLRAAPFVAGKTGATLQEPYFS